MRNHRGLNWIDLYLFQCWPKIFKDDGFIYDLTGSYAMHYLVIVLVMGLTIMSVHAPIT